MNQKESLDLLEIATQRFEQAAEALGLDAGLRAALRYPRRQLVLSLPLKRDDGSLVMVEAHRVQHSIAAGPSVGGVRCLAANTPTDDVARAMGMTWRAALAGVPFGGAAGSLLVDARALSPGERERLARRYAAELSACAGGGGDVIGPDLGTDAEMLGYMYDTLSVTRSGLDAAAVVGRSEALGGGDAIEGAVHGLALCLREACHTLRKSLRTSTVAIQGFGRIGELLARRIHTEGARIVAVADTRGGATSARGLEPERLAEHAKVAGTIVGFRGADRLSHEEFLATKCDILVLAGPELQITQKNAHHVRARVLAELSCAVSMGGERALLERGVCVVPDCVAGIGGMVGAHTEWLRGRLGTPPDVEALRERVAEAQRRVLRSVRDAAQPKTVGWRAAAQALAVERIARIVRERGLFP